KLAEKLQKIISGYQFRWRGKFFTVGLSIGITRLQHGASIASVLSIADAACYKAKENGRSCIHVSE
ncbi:MAG TPA: diguanylate cyclase, partial [Thiotrichales bacterium]|nr:diguanylate cyclase [Thiotrichales bacterium]